MTQNDAEQKELVLQNAERIYQQEHERQKSILEQAGRLLVVQTLIISVLSSATRMYMDYLEATKTPEKITTFEKNLMLIVFILIILSIGFTMIAQHAFKRKGFPLPCDFEEFLKRCEANTKEKEDNDAQYSIQVCMWNQVVTSLYGNNKMRERLLMIASALLMISLIVLSVGLFIALF